MWIWDQAFNDQVHAITLKVKLCKFEITNISFVEPGHCLDKLIHLSNNLHDIHLSIQEDIDIITTNGHSIPYLKRVLLSTRVRYLLWRSNSFNNILTSYFSY